jgi:hypothetical protein
VSRLRQCSTALLVVLLLASCGGSTVADGKRGLVFGTKCYRIPEWNARLINASIFFPFHEKRTSTSWLRLQFSQADVAARVAGYQVPLLPGGKPQPDLFVPMHIPTGEGVSPVPRHKAHVHYSKWYGLGRYANRIIEPIPGTGLYRVWPFPGGETWWVVTRLPDAERRDTHLAKDFWIASCAFHDPARRANRCSTHAERDGIEFDFSTTEGNLPHRDEIARYFTETLQTWEVPCGG